MPQHVRVVPPDPAWAEGYRRERALLMPVFGPLLVELHHIGSTAVEGLWAKPILDLMPVVTSLEAVDRLDPETMFSSIAGDMNGTVLPGWEPERMARLDELFEMYRPVTKEKLWENLKYFLEKLMPVCHECDIKMAIHMDDPPWDIFGLPRLLVDAEAIDRFLSMVDDPYNCLTLCSGSLGANPKNNVAEIVRKHCDRIAFAHIRNVKHFPNGDFSEASHRDCDGDTGILDIVKAYHDCGFEGYIRPDHGRMIWGETGKPGYGLFDRALGATYINGLFEACEKDRK